MSNRVYKKLNEDSRAQLITRSKAGASYAASNQSKGKNRYARRVHSKVANSVKEFNSIDMNKLFKDDILDVNINVHGETNDYVVTIKMSGVMGNLQQELDPNSSANFRQVMKALIKAFNGEDVYIHCSCPDFNYRFANHALKHSISSYDDVFNKAGKIISKGPNQSDNPIAASQAPRFEWTNKNDDKGAACKHVLLVLNNNTWLIKVASVIANYINYMQKNMPDLYANVIYPSIFEKEYIPMSEYSTGEEEVEAEPEDELETDSDTIDTSNKWARTKTQFKKDNPYRFRSDKEKNFDFDSLVSDSEQ